MLPKIHAILGLIFSFLMYFMLNATILEALLIFFASFLIDFDHYLWYIYRKKSFNLKNAYSWFKEKRKKWLVLSEKEREKYKRPYLIFHSIEFWIILFILGYLNQIFFYLLLGILFHIILDYIETIYIRDKLYPKLSLIWVYTKNKNKEHFY